MTRTYWKAYAPKDDELCDYRNSEHCRLPPQEVKVYEYVNLEFLRRCGIPVGDIADAVKHCDAHAKREKQKDKQMTLESELYSRRVSLQ